MNPLSHEPLGLLALGFGLGLRHALDVDHVAAVTAIVGRRDGLRSTVAIGALWGLGHAAALLAVASAVVLARAEIPAGLTRLLEQGVGLMLVGLGAHLLWRLARGATLHHHLHAHGGHVHSHPHLHGAHQHPRAERDSPIDSRSADASGKERHSVATGHHRPGRAALALARGQRPLWIGAAHGLAGSAGLMLAVLATVPGPGLAMAYVALFGCGSIAGMAATSALVALPLRRVAARWQGAGRWIEAGLGLGSIALGLAVAARA